MFQRKDSTGHECIKTVQLQDEATARVYSFFFQSSFLMILLAIVETQRVKKMIMFRDLLEHRLLCLRTIYHSFVLKNEFYQEYDETR